MARKTVRINVPLGNPDDLVALAASIHAKHSELSEGSPLKGLRDLDMTAFGEVATTAVEQRKAAKDHERKAQEANAKASSLIGIAAGQTQNSKDTLLFGITQIRDLLAAINKGNEETLTGWGFDVVVGQAKSRTRKETGK